MFSKTYYWKIRTNLINKDGMVALIIGHSQDAHFRDQTCFESTILVIVTLLDISK